MHGVKIVVQNLKFMFVRKKCTLGLIVFAAAFGSMLEAAPSRYSYYEGTDQSTIREIRDSVDDLRREAGNHEVEIRMFDEKLNTIQSTLEVLRQQMNDVKQSSRDSLKNSSKELEGKFSSLDPLVKGVSADLSTLKRQINDVLEQYRVRLTELEKAIDSQSRNTEHLQTAVASLMELLQGKDVKSIEGDSKAKSYKVKNGDSLEKIAKLHQVSISSLKEANKLQTDRIIIGQTLWIPEK
jgi:LysM repeat protein